jgi:hypothetical protein
VLPSNWIIDWRRFHEVASPEPGRRAAEPVVRRIDPFVVPTLHNLPGERRRPAVQEFEAGRHAPAAVRTAGGQGDEDSQSADAGRDCNRRGRRRREARPAPHTPLWYHILKEAEQRGGGERPARSGRRSWRSVRRPGAGRPPVILSAKGKPFRPSLPSKTPGDFTMADLLRFVGDISPIDGIATV